MSESMKNRKATGVQNFEWVGTAARIRRGGKSVRAGRRSALLSLLSSAYINASRGGRSSETRGGTDRG